MVSAPGCGWPRAYCRGVAGLGDAGARPPAGLIRCPAVLGLAVGLGDPWAYCRGVAARWLDAEFCRSRAYGGVSVGLLLGLVVIHPVRERRACCWCRPGHQGPVKEDHVL